MSPLAISIGEMNSIHWDKYLCRRYDCSWLTSPTSSTNFAQSPATSFSSCSKTDGNFAMVELQVSYLLELSHSKNVNKFTSSLMITSAWSGFSPLFVGACSVFSHQDNYSSTSLRVGFSVFSTTRSQRRSASKGLWVESISLRVHIRSHFLVCPHIRT